MKQKDNMPIMVYLGLVGINSRLLAWGFVWLCISLAAVSLACGFILEFGHLGVMYSAMSVVVFLLCAAWYWYAIRWVDRHSSWEK